MKLLTKTFFATAAICLGAITAFSQEGPNVPKDYLSKEFHAGRRACGLLDRHRFEGWRSARGLAENCGGQREKQQDSKGASTHAN